MKHFLLYFFVLLGLFVVPQNVHAFSGGAGTAESPWQIANATDLAEVSDYLGSDDTDKYFVLTADIDLDVSPYNTGTGWTPIGSSSDRFYGQFDGGGYTISNLFVSTTDDYVGLFGYATSATIENLTLSNAQVTGDQYVGSLIGYGSSMTATNLVVSGAVTSTSGYAGGLVGRFGSGSLQYATSSVNVVHNGTSLSVGGLLGYADSGSFKNAGATGNVTGYSRVGGFAGSFSGSVATVSTTYATGNVTGSSNVGGFVGTIHGMDIHDSYATGNVNGGTTIGGFYGFLQNDNNLYKVYATGNVTGSSDCGGLGAYTESALGSGSLIQDSYATGDVSCSSRVGGLIVYSNKVTLQRTYYAGQLPDSGADRGGLVARGGTNLTVTDSYWDIEVSGLSTTLDDKGTGTTTLAMKTESTFTNWDFDSVWVIDGTNNGGYAYLAYQTFDTTNPTVSTLFPADGASSVTSTANLVITFDETVTVQSGNIVIYNASDDTVFETIDVTGGKVTGSGTAQITVNPAGTFTSEASYYVLIDATAFDDSSSNSYAGISASSTWNFTIADETNPTISTLSPADGGSDIAVDANLVMTFSESVDAESGNITIYNASDDSVFETVDVTGEKLSGSGSTIITINPTTDFTNSGSYYIFVDATAFDDSSSNSYAGISASSTWNFSIVEAASSNGRSNRIAIMPSAKGFDAKGFDTNGSSKTNNETYGLDPKIQRKNSAVFSNANTDVVTSMAVSVDDPSFGGISYEPYVDTFSIDVPNDGKEHVVYIRYRSRTGDVSIDFERIVAPTQSPDENTPDVPETTEKISDKEDVLPAPANTPSVSFPRALELGMFGEDVQNLQKVLNTLNFTVDTTGAGSPGNESTYFGPRTYDAVVRFQSAHAEDVLLPLGLSSPTGYFGPRTIQKIISLL